ncbi:DUF1173 domain-containing protein [Salmonella enterica]|nr:DUF1173 domain-containing protein [Salmonella enterica]
MGSCAAPSAKGDDKFITTDYLQQCPEHRQYVKPMRYDASISEVFPDFYLLDTKSDKPFPMEVFGMATPAYLARKQLKKDYYNREYGPYGWWHWDATTASETMVLPHFPESRKPLSTDTPA